jgi:predicted DNA-binding transcriptional regulator
MELYKTFTFALSPFIVLFFVGFTVYLVSTKPGMQISDLSNSFLIATFVVISLIILFMGLMAEWWVHFFYGKYAKEIRKVIDELKEE